jgi:GNAT superfamily N-acetyltransferase
MPGLPLEFGYLSRHRAFRELGDLARRAYPGPPRVTTTNEAIWREFPLGYVAGWVDGRLEACVQLWPLDGYRAGDFLIGARRERDLTPDDLATLCNSARTVWYFSALLLDPAWRGRGLGAHLLAEAMVRWERDMTWRAPIRFAALVTTPEGEGFVRGFGMDLVRPASETADAFPMYARTFQTEAELAAVVRAARAAADRKGRLVDGGVKSGSATASP